MEIVLLVYGPTHSSWLREGEGEYLKRLKRYGKVRYQVLPEVKNAKGPISVMEDEAKALEKQIQPGDTIILLDEKGKTFTSVKMAQQLQKLFNGSPKRILFVIGGPYGFHDRIRSLATDKWSLSSQTFSHQMVRVFFLEQLYRCFTILNNEPYHHE